MQKLYDQDFYRWTQETAAALRDGRFSAVDVAHVAEEIADMGKRDRKAVARRAAVLMAHLLKWEHQRARRSRPWRDTIDEQRERVCEELHASPSLRTYLVENWPLVYRQALRRVSRDTGMAREQFSSEPRYTLDDLLDPTLPEGD